MPQTHYVSETHILRRIANDPECRYRWTIHALAQMEARGISQPDVQSALMNGQVTLEEVKRDVLWRVEGKDIDGRRIEVVVAADEGEITIKVVTAF